MQLALSTPPLQQIPSSLGFLADQIEAAEAVVELLVELKGLVVNSFPNNADREKIQVEIHEQLAKLQAVALLAGYEDVAALKSIDVRAEGRLESAVTQIETSIQLSISLLQDLRRGPVPEPAPDLPRLEAAEKVLELLTEVKSLVVMSAEEYVSRSKIQEDIEWQLAYIQALAPIAGYAGVNALNTIDVRTETGIESAFTQIEKSLQASIELVHSLGGGPDTEPVLKPTKTEAAEAVVELLLEVKALVISSFGDNLDLWKIQTNIEAQLAQIQMLAPIAGYEGVDMLTSIDVLALYDLRDPAAAETVLEDIAAELTSFLETITGKTKVEPDQHIIGGLENEKFLAGGGDDVILGRGGNDLLSGGAGVDWLFGGTGDDLLYGGAGDDAITGGTGEDKLHGGDGADNVAGGEGDDTIGGGGGDDILIGQSGDDLIFGSAGKDILGGDDGNDTLDGNTGEDELRGGTGNDILRGGDGDDWLLGDGGSDTLYGGDGHDWLKGGIGRDFLHGGNGNDTFVFEEMSGNAFGQVDVVNDFEGAGVEGGDVIYIGGINLDSDIGDALGFTFLGELTWKEGVAAGAGSIWVQDFGTQTRVFGLVDDDKIVDLTFWINDGVETTASDYISSDFLL